METDIAILRHLIDNKSNQYTIKQLSEALRINYRIAHEHIGILEQEGLVRVIKAGHAKLCDFTNVFHTKVYLAENERRKALFRNKDLLVLRNRLAELDTVFIALIFGSHAKRKATSTSDIDLLTIGGDIDAITKTVALWPDPIHLTAISVKEFRAMATSKTFNVVGEALANNIIINGIEEYYRLLNDAY